MYKLLVKNGQLFALLIGVGVIAVYLFSVLGGLSSAGYSMSDDLNQIMKSNPDADFSFFNAGISLTIALIALALIAAVLFGLWQLVTSPKNSIRVIIGVAVLLGLFFILSQTSVVEDIGSKIGALVQKENISEGISKFISGGIKTTFILVAAAFLSAIVFEIINLFK